MASVALPPGRDTPHSLNGRLGEPHSWSGRFGEDMVPRTCLEIELKYFCCPFRSIITKPTALSRQLILADSRQLPCRSVQQEHRYELCLEMASLYEAVPVL